MSDLLPRPVGHVVRPQLSLFKVTRRKPAHEEVNSHQYRAHRPDNVEREGQRHARDATKAAGKRMRRECRHGAPVIMRELVVLRGFKDLPNRQ